MHDVQFTDICRYTWRGNKIHHNEFVLCGYQDDNAPQFGKVLDIIIVKKIPFLIVQLFLTLGVHHHYHSYIIKPTEVKKIINVSDENEILSMSHPLQSHVIDHE